MRDYEKAANEYEKVSVQGEWAVESRRGLAQAYFRQGKVDEAVDVRQKLVEEFSKTDPDGRDQYWIGLYRWRGKDYLEALVELQRFLREYPESKYAKYAKIIVKKIDKKIFDEIGDKELPDLLGVL